MQVILHDHLQWEDPRGKTRIEVRLKGLVQVQKSHQQLYRTDWGITRVVGEGMPLTPLYSAYGMATTLQVKDRKAVGIFGLQILILRIAVYSP